MPQLLSLIVFLSLILIVITRALYFKKKGITVLLFAKTHKSDWLLPPCVAFVIYHLVAYTFEFPRLEFKLFFEISLFPWLGLICCCIGWILFVWGVISFGKSFRVGIDDESYGELITSGAFSVTRNPLYVAFGFELIGFFFNYPNLFFLVVLILGFYVLNRQIIREETFLKECYGEKYDEYCLSVSRYLGW